MTLVDNVGHGSIVPSGPQKCQEVRFRNANDPMDSVRNKELVVYPAYRRGSYTPPNWRGGANAGRDAPVMMFDDRHSTRTDADFDRSQGSMRKVESFLRYHQSRFAGHHRALIAL